MNTLNVWAPNAQKVELVKSDDNKSSFTPPIYMVKTSVTYRNTPMAGYWKLPSDNHFPLNDGDGYWFKITFPSGEIRYRIDPYSRALKHSESYSIYKDPNLFKWTDDGFIPPKFESMIIYQLFQGAYVGRGDSDWKDPAGNNYHFEWNNRRKGDFKQLRNKLDYIQSLGVNTIELLPVNEFNGDNYIGYSSVSFFAIEASYGSINGNGSSYDELKEFINDAHSRNIAVIADVVFNHFGKAGDSGALFNYDNNSGVHSIYFSGEKAYNQAGGEFGLAPDWAKYEVQKYIEDSCNYYLDELHFDGLRFDFTSQIVNKNCNSGENSGKEVLRRIAWNLKTRFPQKILICEHWDETSDDNDNWMISYENFDARWFNYHKRMQGALWPFASGQEERLADAINGGNYAAAYNRIIYPNNHDECWWDGYNRREKFYPVSEFFGWRGDYWSQKKSKMIYSLSFFVPGIPMFFMGDEFLMEGSFNDAHYENILNWELEKREPGPSCKNMLRSLIRIKKTYNPLMKPGASFEWLHYPKDGWFAFKRKWNADALIVAGNYHGNDMFNYIINTNGETGNWTQIFNSDGQEFGGEGVGNYGNNPNSNYGSIAINIPKNGIVAMARTSI